MSLINSVERIIDRYGKPGNVMMSDGCAEVRCFIQPMRYKNKMYMDSQYTKLGIVDESCFLYIGPAQYDLTEGMDASVRLNNGEEYSCVKTEKVYFGERPVYTWAILRLTR